MTMAASFSASALTVAPAAVNSESGRPDLMPAPGSTAISTPSALNFFTVSGEAATRGSDGALFLATAISLRRPQAGGATGDESGQENRHHGDDEDDGGGAVLHQHDEALIGLLVGRIIVAVSGRVGHFVMLCHRSPRSMFGAGVELPQSIRKGNGAAAFVHPPQLQ